MDQIANQAAKIHFMLGGALHVPLVLRTPQGSGTGAAAQHSQNLEPWFASVPGLKVVVPSNPADAKGLLLAAIDDPNPVIFLEHKLLYKIPGRDRVPEGAIRIPLGVSKVVLTGKDLTLVATGIMVNKAYEVAEKLAAEGISITLIDPRTISWIHADSVIALISLAIGLYFVVRVADTDEAKALFGRRLNIFLLIALSQGAIGYIQYFTHLPELIVGMHLLGATLVWVSMWNLALSGDIAKKVSQP